MSEVQTVPVTLNVPQESKEVVDAMGALFDGIRNGGLAGATTALDDLVGAVEGYDKIPAEIMSEYSDDLAAYFVKEVAERLLLRK